MVTIDFDLGYPLFTPTPLTSTYSERGITFVEGAGYCYTFFGNFVLPPSGQCGAIPDFTRIGPDDIALPADDRITVVFPNSASAVGAYVANKIYDNSLTCYNGSGIQVATATLAGFPALGGPATFEFLGVAAPGIRKCTFASVNNTEYVDTFVIDNLSFDPTLQGRLAAAPGKRPPFVPAPAGPQQDKPVRSERITLCAGVQPPAGYILVDIDDSPGRLECRLGDGRSPTNIWRLYTDKPIGYAMGVCSSMNIPSGWILLGSIGFYAQPPSTVPMFHYQNYEDCTMFGPTGTIGGGKVIQRVS